MQKLLGIGIIIILMLSCKSEPYHYSHSEASRIALDSLRSSSSNLSKTIAPYRDSLEKITNRVIGHSAMTMYTGQPESYLTNFVSDLLLNDASLYIPDTFDKQIDFAIMNVYGLRAPIAEGSVTVGDIFRVMPFENKLSLVGLKGSTMQTLLNGFAETGGEGVAGIRFGIKDSAAVNVLINNTEIDTGTVYYGILSDYLAGGGGGMDVMSDHVFREDLPFLLRDVIIWHIEGLRKENKQVSAKLNQRIYVEK